jgi:hypothetical protein
VLLAAASLIQLRLGLRPLHRLREEVAAIRTGERRATTARGAAALIVTGPRGEGMVICRAWTRTPCSVLLLAAASLIQLRLGLRPLHRLREEVAAIRTGERAHHRAGGGGADRHGAARRGDGDLPRMDADTLLGTT